ncbi:MAG: AMP-binding protein [Pseudomonadota bacterium]
MPLAHADACNLTVTLLDEQIAAGLGGKKAIVAGQRRVSYEALLLRVRQACALPGLRDLPPGALVALVFDDQLDAAIALLAVMRLGLVACQLNPGLAAERLEQQVRHGGCAAALCCPAGAAKLAGWQEQGGALHVVAPSLGGENADDSCHLGPAARPAFCLFTSGTTGQPSAVLHRHADVDATWRQYGSIIAAIGADDILFTSSKLFYAYGLNALFFALRAGATLVLAPEPLDAARIWQTLRDERVTVCFCVPTIYARLLDAADIPALPALRLAVSAGENLPLALYENWRRHVKAPLIDGIGTTETLSTFISNRPYAVRPGSSGQLVPGFIARIVDTDGKPVAPGEVGALWIKGDTYIPGYHNAPEATVARFVDGWFATNDLFSCDTDGYFYYHGRASEIIKCGGIWIYPSRVEDVLMTHPAVLECAVAGQRQDNGLQRPAAWVVLKSGHAQSPALAGMLQGHCKDSLSSLEYPHFIHFTDDIPKTATGKKMRFQLAGSTTLKENQHVRMP